MCTSNTNKIDDFFSSIRNIIKLTYLYVEIKIQKKNFLIGNMVNVIFHIIVILSYMPLISYTLNIVTTHPILKYKNGMRTIKNIIYYLPKSCKFWIFSTSCILLFNKPLVLIKSIISRRLLSFKVLFLY